MAKQPVTVTSAKAVILIPYDNARRGLIEFRVATTADGGNPIRVSRDATGLDTGGIIYDQNEGRCIVGEWVIGPVYARAVSSDAKVYVEY